MSAQPWLDGVSAQDLALSVFRNPGGHASLLGGRGMLPDDVLDVMRLAQEAARHHDEPGYDEDRHRAALFFVEHVLLSSGSDHYRVLGLISSADIDAVREHYRLMMAIFHPDRSPWLRGDRENLAARINVAYRVLRDPATRAAYDLDHGRSKTIHMPGAGAAAGGPAMGIPRTQPEEPLFSRLPAVVQRYFPQFVLGGVAMLGLLLVLATYINRAPPEAIGMGAVRGARATPELPDRARRPLLAMAQEKVAPADANNATPPVEVPKPPSLEPKQPQSQPMSSKRPAADKSDEQRSVPAPPPVAPLSANEPDANRETKSGTDDAPPRTAESEREEAKVLRVAHQVAATAPEQAAEHVPEPVARATEAGSKPTVASTTADVAAGDDGSGVASDTGQTGRVEGTGKTERVEVVAAVPPTVPEIAQPLSNRVAVEAPNERVADNPELVQPEPVIVETAAAPVMQPPAALRGVGHREAQALLEHFTDAYRRGDLDELMTLFSKNARSNSGRHSDIRADYEGLFRLTRARDIEFHDLRWTFENERGKAEGAFVARVLAYGQDSEGVHVGNLRFELVEVGGRVLIEELFHSGSN
jgi:hypothetical protein